MNINKVYFGLVDGVDCSVEGIEGGCMVPSYSLCLLSRREEGHSNEQEVTLVLRLYRVRVGAKFFYFTKSFR